VTTGLGSSQSVAVRRSLASARSRSGDNYSGRSPIKKQVHVLRRETPHGPPRSGGVLLTRRGLQPQ
jgi:hypothetical protein